MKQEIALIIKETLGQINVDIDAQEILGKIEVPTNKKFGDFAFPCFLVAKKLSSNPNAVALQLQGKFRDNKEFEKVEVVGPYLNFYLNKVNFTKKKLIEALSPNQHKAYSQENGTSKNILVEFPSPNTNKPLHLGHLRNMAIGESVARMLESVGHKVFRVNLYNDKGIHICKSMLMYKKFGENKDPDKKPDHFIGDFYVMFAKLAKEDESYNKEAQEMLALWESGDPEVRSLWEKMNNWAYEGYRQTFELLGIKHDKCYYESEIFDKGKEIVLDGLQKGIFSKRDDGAIIMDLTSHGLEQKVLLRPDGTTVYMTQDLFLAKLKEQDYNPDISIHVVGNEQDYHFKVLFTILKEIGFQKQLTHLSYGIVELPDGRMKSREGTVVDADDLIENVRQLAKAEISERYPDMPEEELKNKSLIIALAAIKYTLLKVNIFRTMVFNPKESINFEGDTGPYLLYSYARACNILDKVGSNAKHTGTYNPEMVATINEHEYELIKKVSEWENTLKTASDELNPSVIAHYSYELARTFNEFYHACPVIKGDNIDVRIMLVQAFLIVMKKSLYVLGLDVLEKM